MRVEAALVVPLDQVQVVEQEELGESLSPRPILHPELTSPTFNPNSAPARSLNSTSTLTTSPLNLSSTRYVTFWVRSPRTGSFAQFQFGQSVSSEQTFPFTISSANTWEQKTWDISGIAGGSRTAVTKFAFKVTDDSQNTTLYFDDVEYNSPPNIPSLDLPSNGATNQSLLPVLKTTATDNESDYLKYKIILCTNAGMSTGCQTFDQTSSQTGWSGQNTQSSTAYTSGTQGAYTVQSLLSITIIIGNHTQLIRAEQIYWSSTQVSPYSFTTTASISAPTLDYPADGAVSQAVVTPLKTTATDSLGDYLRYKIILCTNSGMSVGCQTFDETSSQTGWSGQNYPPGGPYTAYTSGTQAVYTIQAALNPGVTYYWKSYAIDPGHYNVWGPTQTSPYSFTTTTLILPNNLLTNSLTNPTGVTTPLPVFTALCGD